MLAAFDFPGRGNRLPLAGLQRPNFSLGDAGNVLPFGSGGKSFEPSSLAVSNASVSVVESSAIGSLSFPVFGQLVDVEVDRHRYFRWHAVSIFCCEGGRAL